MSSNNSPIVHILFYLRKSKTKSNGQAPIYCRLTVDSKRIEFSIKRYVDTTRWNAEGNCVKGTKEDARTINTYLDHIQTKIRKIENDFIQNNQLITADSLRNRYLGKDEIQKTVLDVFAFHNQQMKERIGIEYSEGTHKRFKTTLRHIEQFMSHQYKRNDMRLTKLKFKFITDLEHYLKTVRKCNHNSSLKYIRNFRKIINIALANDWLVKDPFVNYKVKIKEVIRGFLSNEELQAIEDKVFEIERLDAIRDIFVFCCYTGLAYIDVSELAQEDIVIGIDGTKWISSTRGKTGSKFNVPLLPKALEILEKYENHIECEIKGKLLPVRSNQKTNAYLKEIADLCGIKKTLTFHLSRHTFATTVTLTNNVPIESVSSMLGHKSIRTTQIYAKVVERKVSDDMNMLREKLRIKYEINLKEKKL